jgi:hypothetical protein
MLTPVLVLTKNNSLHSPITIRKLITYKLSLKEKDTLKTLYDIKK